MKPDTKLLQSISIRNFRCFEQSEFEGFAQVNLIGGKNNSGKSALLEALLVASSPNAAAVLAIQRFRNEFGRTARFIQHRVWDTIFFNQNKDEKAELLANYYSEMPVAIEISESTFLTDRAEMQKFEREAFAGEPVAASMVTVRSERDGKAVQSVIKSTRLGIRAELEGKNLANFIHGREVSDSDILASEFDRAYDNGQYLILMDVLRTLDSTITEARTSSAGSPVIKLKREGEKPLPLSYFGDALNKTMAVVLKLLNSSPNSVLLIDEIENGIHYTSQKDYWRAIFALAEKFQIQVFATSHNFEMIRAFNELALEENLAPNARYFEMARHVKTNQIFASCLDMEMLEYELKSNSKFRGE